MRWTKRRNLAERYFYSLRTIDRRISEIEELQGIRYPARSVLRSSSGVRIREDVATDYLEHRDEILIGVAPAFIGG